MPTRYYITYTAILALGAAFFASGFLGFIPNIPCVFSKTTGINCPSCGITRSVFLAIKGNFGASIKMHPFGIAVIFGIIAIMILSIYGIIKKSELEFLFNKWLTYIAILAIIIYLSRWIINVM